MHELESQMMMSEQRGRAACRQLRFAPSSATLDGRLDGEEVSRTSRRRVFGLAILFVSFLCGCSTREDCRRGGAPCFNALCNTAPSSPVVPIQWIHAREARDRGAQFFEQFAEFINLPAGESVRLIAEGLRVLPEDWLHGHWIAHAVGEVWHVRSRMRLPNWRRDAMEAAESLIADPNVASGRKLVALLDMMVPLVMDDGISIEYDPEAVNGFRIRSRLDRSLKAESAGSVLQVIKCLGDQPVEILRLGSELVKLGYWVPEMIAPLQGAAMEVIDSLDESLEADAMAVDRLVTFFWQYRAVVSGDLVNGLLGLGRQDRLSAGALWTVLMIALSRPGETRALGIDILSDPGHMLDWEAYTKLVRKYAEVVPDEMATAFVSKIVADGLLDSVGEDGAALRDVRRSVIQVDAEDAEDIRARLRYGEVYWSPRLKAFTKNWGDKGAPFGRER